MLAGIGQVDFLRLRNCADCMKNAEQARSLMLAFLMVGSVMVGIFYLDIQNQAVDEAPAISGDEPGAFVIGDVSSITVKITDEEPDSMLIDITLDGERVPNVNLDTEGRFTVDISSLGVGPHSLKVIAKDRLLQETRWYTDFTISYPEEDITEIVLDAFATTIPYGDDAILSGNLTHSSLQSCEFDWTDGDLNQSRLAVGMEETGHFFMQFPDMQDNLTISMEARCGINIFTNDTVIITYTVEVPEEPEGSNEENGEGEGGEGDGSENGQ